MSHTNSTTNYSLPQFVTTDKPAWLTDVNNAYTAIDTGMHNAQTKANTADTNASQALLDAASAASAASAADAKGAGAVASLADTFQATETYAVGDLVIYNNLLYVCSVAVETPGSWTGSTNWSRVTVEGFVNGKTAEDIPLDDSEGAISTGTAIGNLQTMIKSESGYATMSADRVYSDYLYADIDFATINNTKVIGVTVVGNPTNRPAFAILVSGLGTATRVRVYATSYSAGSTIGIKVTYVDI